MTHQSFDPGTLVYDAHGKWIGIVSPLNEPGSYLVVQKGRWFPKDLYLPLSSIAHADDEGLYLHLSKVDLTDRGYTLPPPSPDDERELAGMAEARGS